jgi:N-acetylmuramoyl-L-alanine amidase
MAWFNRLDAPDWMKRILPDYAASNPFLLASTQSAPIEARQDSRDALQKVLNDESVPSRDRLKAAMKLGAGPHGGYYVELQTAGRRTMVHVFRGADRNVHPYLRGIVEADGNNTVTYERDRHGKAVDLRGTWWHKQDLTQLQQDIATAQAREGNASKVEAALSCFEKYLQENGYDPIAKEFVAGSSGITKGVLAEYLLGEYNLPLDVRDSLTFLQNNWNNLQDLTEIRGFHGGVPTLTHSSIQKGNQARIAEANKLQERMRQTELEDAELAAVQRGHKDRLVQKSMPGSLQMRSRGPAEEPDRPWQRQTGRKRDLRPQLHPQGQRRGDLQQHGQPNRELPWRDRPYQAYTAAPNDDTRHATELFKTAFVNHDTAPEIQAQAQQELFQMLSARLNEKYGPGGPRVVLDAGHGGSDRGTEANGLVESELTGPMVEAATSMLGKLGVDVQNTDRTLSAVERAKRAKKNWPNAAAYVSVHANRISEHPTASLPPTAYINQSSEFARRLGANITDFVGATMGNGQTGRVVDQSNSAQENLAAVNLPGTPANVVLEMGNIGNERFASQMRDPTSLKNYGYALAVATVLDLLR